MLIWVIYDISSDRERTKIAKSCLEHGLQRIQKSVFLGDLPAHCADEIAEFSRELIDEKTGILRSPQVDLPQSLAIMGGVDRREPLHLACGDFRTAEF
jgi:CRISPR-associated protein Cas2